MIAGMPTDWTSYDAAAVTHDRLNVPAMFAAPARDLGARMDFANARAALDVGAGSGIVAMQAATVCPVAVAVDPSVAMLRRARANGIARVVVGAAPGLPFADASFDRVTAGFVLSHVASYEAALADMVRVLRPGGKVGITAWSELSNPYRDYWDGLVERFVGDAEALRAATAKMLPWEDWFARSENVRSALSGAGLHDVTVEEIEYPIHITIADFLAIRENSGVSRFLRTVLDDAGWRRFLDTAREEFAARFRDPIDHTRRAIIAVGTL
jgi:ubiquinone/menaquinone biosynthesis C-methylase UbiE